MSSEVNGTLFNVNQSKPKTYHCAYLYLLTGCHASPFQEDHPSYLCGPHQVYQQSGLQVVHLGCHDHSIMDHDRKLGMVIPGLDRDLKLGMVIPGLDRDRKLGIVIPGRDREILSCHVSRRIA